MGIRVNIIVVDAGGHFRHWVEIVTCHPEEGGERYDYFENGKPVREFPAGRRIPTGEVEEGSVGRVAIPVKDLGRMLSTIV